MSLPIDHPDILLVLPPSIGHPDRFASLGQAQLLACCTQAGLAARSVNLSELLFRTDEPLYRSLYEAGGLERFYAQGLWGTDAAYLDAMLTGEQDPDLAASIAAFADLAARRIQDSAPALVGLTVLQSNLAMALALGTRLTEAGIPVLAGGPACHEPAMAARLLDGACHLIVRGEGEIALPGLVSGFRDSGRLPDQGIIEGVRVPDLDALPVPDFDTDQPLAWLPVASSRGCTCRCHFCEESALFPGMRRRSVPRVIDEIARNRERYQAQGIQFHDSLINHDRAALLALCQALRPLGLGWQGYARPTDLDDALIRTIADSGCTGLHLGVEHFSQPVSDALGKRLDVNQAQNTIERVATQGIAIKLLIIEGVPGETEDDHQRNLEAIEGLLRAQPGQVSLAVNPLMITPGSALFRAPERHGIRLVREGDRVTACEFERGPDRDTIARWVEAVLALR